MRHAQSRSREGLVYEAGAKVGLSDTGKKRAQAAANYLKQKIKPDIVYSSPLARSKETAEIVARTLGLSINFDDRVVEYAPSRSVTGVAFKEAKRRARLNKDLSPADGESFNEAAKRFIEFLNQLSTRDSKRPLVVTHALVMQCALVNLFNLNDYPHLDEVSISELEFDGHKFHLNYLNETSFISLHFLRKAKEKIKKFFKSEDSYF